MLILNVVRSEGLLSVKSYMPANQVFSVHQILTENVTNIDAIVFLMIMTENIANIDAIVFSNDNDRKCSEHRGYSFFSFTLQNSYVLQSKKKKKCSPKKKTSKLKY